MATNEPKLGELIDGTDAARDAIHIAVAPVIANEKLSPGQDVGFVDGGTSRVGVCDKPIGIVDPFLKKMVYPEQRLWLFLYPRTITSLRHEWTHPAFERQVGVISHEDHIAKSRVWIADHARLMHISEAELMADAKRWLETGCHTVEHGSEHWRDSFRAKDFWHHYEIVTGTVVPDEDKSSFYCCSC